MKAGGGEVTAVMPANSNSQLLKFLSNENMSCEFFNAYADAQPAHSIGRKLQRHYNKIYCEFVMLGFLRNFDFRNSIVHIDIAPWQSMFVLIWLCLKTRVFVTVHNSVLPIPKHRYLIWQLKFRILSRFKNFNVFTANEDAKKSLQTLVPKRFYKNITVTYANINSEEIASARKADIDPRRMREKYNIPGGKFLVFCVGQFIDRKGRWVFLKAAAKLCQPIPDIAFVWISNSRTTSIDWQKVQNFDLGENFVFISSEQVGERHLDLLKLLRLADLFVLPSYVEGLPISLLEAMSLGIPSISTNVNGIPEAIKHLETGILIEPGDDESLKNAVCRLKDDESLRKTLSENGRKFVLENFNEQSVAEIAEKSYLESFR